MRNNIKNIAILLSSFIILSSCSSGGPTTPNKPALPNLQKNPSTSPEVEIKRINLNGRIIDSITRKPVENANIIIYAVTNDKIFKTLSNQSVAVSTPESSAPSTTVPSSISSSVEPITNPAPIEEEEEKVKDIKKVVPTSSSKPNQSKSNQKNNKSKGLELPKNTVKTVEKNEEEVKEEKELKFDVVTALADLKPNDIEQFDTKTGNDGKFWLNKIPENNLIITVSAENYQSTSVFSAETAKIEDILLKPVSTNETGYLKGFVLSANNNVSSNATVSSSYVAGDDFSVPENTSETGDFLLKNLSVGERTIFASVKDESGKIVAMGMKDIQIKKSQLPKEEKAKESPNPSPLSSPNTEKEKKKEGEEIKVKAVTNYVNLKGKIQTIEGLTLKSVNVYVEFKKKGLPKEEFFLLNEELPSKADSFDLELPELEAGYYYHLEFSAYDKKGAYVYHHEYRVKPESKTETSTNTKDKKDSINVKFIKPVTQGISDYIEKEQIKLPIFNWEPAEGADFYKVTLYRSDKLGITQSIWEAYTPFNSAVYVSNEKNEKEKFSKEYKYTWTVEALREKAETRSTADKISFAKLNLLSWSDLSRSPEFDFEVPEAKVDEIEEIDPSKKKEG